VRGARRKALRRYDALRPAHRGRGVATVENGICQQCRISLTPATLHRARSSAELVTCGNCGCILYVP
jgi:predicted  nucleic acid-binding Zn-ribbon protein